MEQAAHDLPVRGIRRFHLVTQDLPRLTGFYRDVLGFAIEGDVQPIGTAELQLLGIEGAGRRQVLGIGDQSIAIDTFGTAGRPCPADGDAASLWFQHLALIVADMAPAHARLRDTTAITTGGPQHLPAAAGGVHALKFRDPDGHPLELLQFPSATTPAAWQGRSARPGQIALGIDHSAISVRDTAVSTAFYAGLGLRAAGRTLNSGPAQQRLDGLRDVEVDVVALQPEDGTPHMELLGYRVPRGAAGSTLRANDMAATRVLWRGRDARLLCDPDGHLLQVERSASPLDL